MSRPICWITSLISLLVVVPGSARAELFRLPTANQAIFEPGGEERFFVGTTGRTWESGTFGGVRSGGYQFHEGLDIRCLNRDKRGEPTDPILASASGKVAYINRKAGLSNYGNYLILQHRVDGIEVYTVYAHLSEVRQDLREGMAVQAGEQIAIMGRTANTREGISKERAHLHFEIGLLISDRFASWHNQYRKGQRNDHGNWNGQAMRGLDPRKILLNQRTEGDRFSLANFIRNQTELCRVQVRKVDFPWLRRYPALIARNPRAEQEGVAGYEISFNFVGVPYRMTPLSASELKSKNDIYLVSVNAPERARDPSGKLVTERGGQWELTQTGRNLISLLTH